MSIKFRHYIVPDDYQRIDAFFIEHYQPGNQDGNWIEPAWEYMHAYSWLGKAAVGRLEKRCS
jgi:hypothetical protein